MFAQRLGVGRSRFDIILDGAEGLAQGLVVGLAREDLQALDEGQTGIDHGRELPREDDDIPVLDLLRKAGDADLDLSGLGAHPRRVEALPAKKGVDRFRAGCLHASFFLVSGAARGFPIELRHGSPPGSPPG